MERAADIMETGWCTQFRAKDAEDSVTFVTSEDAARWCAVGALELAFSEATPNSMNSNMNDTQDYRACMNALSKALPRTERFPGFLAWQQAIAVVNFNNRQEEGTPVVALFQTAARTLADNTD